MTDTSKPELVETAMAAVCDCIAIDYPGADNASDGETLMLFHGIGPTGTGGHITLNIKEVVEAVLSVTGYEQLSSAKAEIERLRVGIKEVLTEVDAEGAAGGWRPCTGCHETSEGYSTGRYVVSAIFDCEVGIGCTECGGIGVVWHYYDAKTLTDWAADTNPSPDPKDAVIAELVGALEDMLFLAEAEHVCLLSWNQTGSAANYDGITRKAKSALSHAKQGGSDG